MSSNLPPLPEPTTLGHCADSWREIKGHTDDQMLAYGKACAAEYERERDALRDCRLCANFTAHSGGCVAVVQCVDGEQYEATAPRQYWIARTDENGGLHGASIRARGET